MSRFSQQQIDRIVEHVLEMKEKVNGVVRGSEEARRRWGSREGGRGGRGQRGGEVGGGGIQGSEKEDERKQGIKDGGGG